MGITYKEILNSMKTAYFEETGEAVKSCSDLELRLKSVATEIYSVCAYNDFILKQGFPQTATGEYLERHARLRGITRKKASKAKGSLTFSLESASKSKITVPAGTVCSVNGSPFLQFATDDAAEINAGETRVTVKATALREGYDHNVPAGTVTVTVNPFSNLSSVTNEYSFFGGEDDESDESLRKRVLDSYSDPTSNLSVAAVEQRLMTIDGVRDAYVCAAPDYTLRVCLKTDGAEVPSAINTKVKDILGFAALCSVEIITVKAQERLFYAVADINISGGYKKDEVEKAVREKLTAFCSGERIGKNYSESAAAAACAGIDGVEYISVYFASPDGKAVSCGSEEYLKLERVEVNINEQ